MRRLLRSRAFWTAFILLVFYLYGGYRTANSFDRYCISESKKEQPMTAGYKIISLGGILRVSCAPGTEQLSVKTYNALYALWPFYVVPSAIVEVPAYFLFQGGIGHVYDALKDIKI